jgi:hypothetical protein
MTALRTARSRAARVPPARVPGGAARLSTVSIEPGPGHSIALDATPPPGIDEARFDSATLHIEALEDARSLPRNSVNSAGALALRLTPTPPQATASLARIEIDGLTPSAGSPLRVGDARFLPGEDAPRWNFPAQPNEAALRLLLRPARGSGFAPPIAAAPAFPMPGAGRDMYGTALGGASLAVRRGVGDRLDLTLTPNPTLAGTAVELLLGAVPPGEDTPQLPNEVAPVAWRAVELRSVWNVAQGGLVVTLGDAALATLEQPPARGTTLDFAPALRAALKQAIAAGTTPPALRIATPASTRLRLGVSLSGLRWIANPPDANRAVLGAPAVLRIPLAAPDPERLDATISGRFGPARLIAGSDATPPQSRAGLVVAGATQGARMVTLTGAEQALPIRRAGVFGRAAAQCEITLALHAGAPGVVGARIGDPVAIAVAPAAAPDWHRADWPAPFLLPPHRSPAWLVARARRGAFLWHARAEDGEALASPDEGGVWTRVPAAPLAQLHVHDPEGPPGPLALRVDGAVLETDIAGGAKTFRLDWQAPAAVLGRATGALALGFDAARDADVTVAEIDVTFGAGG